MVLVAEKEYPGVEKDFWPYLQLFEEASAERGDSIELANSGVTISYSNKGKGELEGPRPPAGTCQHNPEDNNSILIDFDTWGSVTRYAQEQIIFHELGHCSLQRGHDESTRSDGTTCKSIMRSGTGPCHMEYNEFTRKGYLDELFSK